ncbi:hypothetical protein [Geomonas azotofigens]|uniref:hypothetical protein n=1 Tax=Geomonas azotofigens TaxID=2843196 RepID=UPI001C1268F4|nr:hypothetical protein [Geomonas azotofigens]MBU5612628.1 hypothetical protein [Geomonas azotofigens]
MNKSIVSLLVFSALCSTAFAGPPPVTGSVEISGTVAVDVKSPNPLPTKSPDSVWVTQKEGLALSAGSPSLTTDAKYNFWKCRVGIKNENAEGTVVNVRIYDPVSNFTFDSFTMNEPGQHATYIDLPGGGISIANDAIVTVLGILCR